MSLRTKKWKAVYRAGDQNLIEEFYKPLLADAIAYDRAVGFFSAEVLSANLQGIGGLVRNGGRMRLIIGHPLDDDEFFAVKQGYLLRESIDFCEKLLVKLISDSIELRVNRLALLSELIATNRLEIKFALRRRGMYHEKIGIVTDKHGDKIVFQGSANETAYALCSGFNAELIMSFCSWKEEIFSEYGTPCIDGFESLWLGQQANTVTIEVPSEFYERLASAGRGGEFPVINADDLENEFYEDFFSKKQINIPSIPKTLNGKKFEILEHQKSAIQKWKLNNFKGILKLATGSGKTITSCFAATKVYEGRKQANRKLALVVAVPYVNLANQWVENLRAFNIYPIECWNSLSSWSDALYKEVTSFSMSSINFICIVVVNKTLKSKNFQSQISRIDASELMLIGDECHNHGTEKIYSSLPLAYYRMGLSATPFRSDEDEFDSPFPNEARSRILAYYGDIVATYSLADAIHDGVLCEYDYHIVPTRLTAEEQEIFDSLTTDINRLLSMRSTTGLSKMQVDSLTQLCGRRSRLLGNASNKLVKLREIVSEFPTKMRKQVLFYCGEGATDKALADSADDEKAILEISRILKESGWITSRFTSAETAKERVQIMNNFKDGNIDALVSIKVLDEGFDVPACSTAFILASTKNPRQYVQRRGRVLRKQAGKQKATIFDFVVLPFTYEGKSSSYLLVRSELERVDDFCKLALNRASVEKKIDELGMRNEY